MGVRAGRRPENREQQEAILTASQEGLDAVRVAVYGRFGRPDGRYDGMTVLPLPVSDAVPPVAGQHARTRIGHDPVRRGFTLRIHRPSVQMFMSRRTKMLA
jgi:hypothetical protein